MSAEEVFAFGNYRFFVTQRLLIERERPVRMGNRAREILAVLLEHAGEIVPKGVLMKRIWPSTFVEEGTLRVHIAALRSVLKKDRSIARYVETVTGIGYRFVAPLEAQARAVVTSMIDLDQQALPQIVEYLEKKDLLVVPDDGCGMIASCVWAALREMFERS